MTEDWYLSLYGERCRTTGFFRSLDYCHHLPDAIKEQWISNGRQRIKIAIIGCSTGQEAYSYSLTCHSLDIDYEVHGFDVHDDRLEKAQKGHYPTEEEVINTHPSLINKVTLRSTAGFIYQNITFHREILKNTLFFQHDISISPLSSPYNVVICTNVLGQPQRGGRENAIHHVVQAVTEGGICLVNYGDQSGTIPYGLSKKINGILEKI